MANRNDFDDFFGDDDTAPIADTRADGRLYRVPLARLSRNLVNPRTEFGTEDDLIDFGKSLARRQNQPCPVVSRTAYLKLWPEHAEQIGNVDYVLVSGERRYRGATAVGLPGLDCVVNDDFARDRKTFMEAVVSENVDRQNFDPVEEAYAVQALVEAFGTNRAVAQHFERADGWVTQRILLTHLAPSMQKLVRAKELPVEAARTLGKLARDNQWDGSQQDAWWQQEKDRRAAAAQARAAAKRTAAAAPPPAAEPDSPTPAAVPEPLPVAAPSFTAVKPAAPPTPTPASPSAAQPVPPASQGPAAIVPEPRTVPEPPEEPGPPQAVAEGRKLPYGNGPIVGRHLALKMASGPFLEALMAMATECWDKAGEEASFDVLRAMLETAAEHDPKRLNELADEFLRRTDEGMALEGSS